MHQKNHAVIAYFAGWHLGESGRKSGCEVSELPWDSVSIVNHAFWYAAPLDNPEVSSFGRRESGLGARKRFAIVPMFPELDCGDCGESTVVPGLPRNHFAQYAYFAEKYPDVKIMLSIGGWTKSGFFSEMAYTAEGRDSFVSACLELMERYPWIGGIDIDWEYPAGTRDGERRPDPGDPGDQGCPIFGTAAEDRSNFAELLARFRRALDDKYGAGAKLLTACASGSTAGTLPCQDWKAAAQSLDLINIMSYDLAGIWDGVTGHASSAAQSAAGVEYFRDLGIPMEKICIGSPLYGTPFLLKEAAGNPLGGAAVPRKPIPTEKVNQAQLLRWEAEAVSGYRVVYRAGRYSMAERFDRGGTGWHMEYDASDGGAYLYHDDPAGECFGWFISYENPLSLQNKLDMVLENGIGGIIVWESSQDTPDCRMLRQMHDMLLK